MRSMIASAMIAFVATFLCAAAAPAFAQGEFSLNAQEVGEPARSLVWMARRYLGPTDAKPARLKGLPKELSRTVSYFVAPLGGREVVFALDHKWPPKLYADTDGDDDLSDEQPATAQDGGRWTVSVPCVLRGARSPLKLMAEAQGVDSLTARLLLWPAEVRTGEALLAQTRHRVAVVDANLDGRYDGVYSAASGATSDWLIIDLDGSGSVEGPAYDSEEILPLPELLRVANAWYSLDVEPDGSAIRATAAKPQFGRLDPGSPDVSLKFLSENGTFRLEGKDRPWELPVGQYRPDSARLVRADERGAEWALAGRSLRDTGPIEIRADRATVMKVGAPLVASATASIDGRAASLGFVLHGQGGEQYSPGVQKNGVRQSAPTFKIVDEAGKVLHSAKFEYG